MNDNKNPSHPYDTPLNPISIVTGVYKGRVMVDFGRFAVHWIGLSIEEARDLADALMRQAEAAEGFSQCH